MRFASSDPITPSVRVTLTEFIDFLVTSGTPRITQARAVRSRRLSGYSPQSDFYKSFRDCVRSERFRSNQAEALKLLVESTGATRKSSFQELSHGIMKFLKKKSIDWLPPPRAEWSYENLSVTINPEWRVILDGQCHIIKLIFKEGNISRQRAEIVNYLMEQTLEPKIGPAIFGVLNVRKGTFLSSKSKSSLINTLLECEAATFTKLYMLTENGLNE
jgi:hypothetical protein